MNLDRAQRALLATMAACDGYLAAGELDDESVVRTLRSLGLVARGTRDDREVWELTDDGWRVVEELRSATNEEG